MYAHRRLRCRPQGRHGHFNSPRASNRDGPGRASSRLPLERCDSARAGGSALPVIMSIIRSSRNPRLPQTTTSECAVQLIKKNKKNIRFDMHFHFSRMCQLYVTVHTPCSVLRLDPMHPGCGLVLGPIDFVSPFQARTGSSRTRTTVEQLGRRVAVNIRW